MHNVPTFTQSQARTKTWILEVDIYLTSLVAIAWRLISPFRRCSGNSVIIGLHIMTVQVHGQRATWSTHSTLMPKKICDYSWTSVNVSSVSSQGREKRTAARSYILPRGWGSETRVHVRSSLASIPDTDPRTTWVVRGSPWISHAMARCMRAHRFQCGIHRDWYTYTNTWPRVVLYLLVLK